MFDSARQQHVGVIYSEDGEMHELDQTSDEGMASDVDDVDEAAESTSDRLSAGLKEADSDIPKIEEL